ncbi:MAG: DUF2573 family protein [Bacilli bacterium]
MDEKFKDQYETLLKKYSELLVGDDSPEMMEKVQQWIVYLHISKQMPPLTKHWSERFPEGKTMMIAQINEIKTKNEQVRQKKME